MNISFSKHENILVVSLNGELDHHSAETVRMKIDNKIDETKLKNLVLDFSGVNFMDSSGIGVVIGRYRKIMEWDGKLGIINLNPTVKRIFELSALFKIVKEYKSLDEAAITM